MFWGLGFATPNSSFNFAFGTKPVSTSGFGCGSRCSAKQCSYVRSEEDNGSWHCVAWFACDSLRRISWLLLLCASTCCSNLGEQECLWPIRADQQPEAPQFFFALLHWCWTSAGGSHGRGVSRDLADAAAPGTSSCFRLRVSSDLDLSL